MIDIVMTITNYESSNSINIYGFICSILDLFLVPVVLMSCWNVVIPKTFDSVHSLTYMGAFFIRIVVSLLFGNSFLSIVEDNDRKCFLKHYINEICNTIQNNKPQIQEPVNNLV
jgi:hypothetical protein